MELEKQVCSLELAKRLKELGVKQQSSFYWAPMFIETHGTYYFLVDDKYALFKEYAAFTLAELDEMLPKTVRYYRSEITADVMKGRGTWPYFCEMWRPEGKTIVESGDTEADARAKILVHLLEKNIIPSS